ncbi:hypothetical protein VDGL01_03446 [Verticillium dahliae]
MPRASLDPRHVAVALALPLSPSGRLLMSPCRHKPVIPSSEEKGGGPARTHSTHSAYSTSQSAGGEMLVGPAVNASRQPGNTCHALNQNSSCLNALDVVSMVALGTSLNRKAGDPQQPSAQRRHRWGTRSGTLGSAPWQRRTDPSASPCRGLANAGPIHHQPTTAECP